MSDRGAIHTSMLQCLMNLLEAMTKASRRQPSIALLGLCGGANSKRLSRRKGTISESRRSASFPFSSRSSMHPSKRPTRTLTCPVISNENSKKSAA